MTIAAYEGIAIGTLAFAVFCALSRFVTVKRGTLIERITSTPVFLVASCASLFEWRWPSMWIDLPLDPDESTFISLAHRALTHGVPWGGIDATTSGPLNVLVLTFFHFFGLSFSFASARFVATLLIAATLIASYFCVRLSAGESGARLTAALLLLFSAAVSSDLEFAGYSSESVPLCLIALLSLSVAGAATRRRGLGYYCATAGALAGAVPFAKLQAVPIAAVLAMVMFAVLFTRPLPQRTRLSLMATFAAASMLVPAAMLLPVTLSGAWNDFVVSYVRELFVYQNGAVVPQWFASGQLGLSNYPFVLIFFIISGGILTSVLTLALLSGKRSESRCRKTTRRQILLFSVTLTLTSAIYSVAAPNRPWPHYFLFLVPVICVLAGSTLEILLVHRRLAGEGRLVSAAFVSVFFLAAIVPMISADSPYRAALMDGRNLHVRAHHDPLLRRIERGSSIAVWGWRPDLYVATDTVTATRDSITQFQMWPGPYQTYYLHRYVHDMESSRPRYFIDSVDLRECLANAKTLQPQSRQKSSALVCRNTVPSNRHENYPLVASYIARNYTFIGTTDTIRLYRRNDTRSLGALMR